MSARVGVVLFPGSNCEQDALEAVRHLGGDAELLWHGDTSLGGVDAVIVPGGFAHGDYLRPGAIARFSPVMDAVAKLAADGGPVIGICNGFQTLVRAGLLPGALGHNASGSFQCEWVTLDPQLHHGAEELHSGILLQSTVQETRLGEDLEPVADPDHRAAIIRKFCDGRHYW